MPAGSVLQSVFTESKRLSHLGYRTWYTKAKELAQSYDTDIANVGDMVSSKQAIKNNIEGHYKTSWENKMQDTENFPILRTYKLFKQIFTCENYLYLLKNDKYRTALSKFRTSSHNLEVERGRHTNPVTPLERRLCLMCQEIEDEIHFTTQKFSNFCTLNDSEKFIFLMQSNDAHVITWMAKFVYRSMSKRSDILLSEV